MNTLKRQSGLAWGFSFLCAVAILTVARTRAQDASLTPSLNPQLRPHHVIPLHIVHGEITDVNGPNSSATLSNIVDYLESKDPNSNIILPADMGQIKIGDLHLRGASVDLVLQAASAASGDQFLVEERGSGTGATGLIVIKKSQKPDTGTTDVTVQAFSLAGYLNYRTFDMLHRYALRDSGQITALDETNAKLDECLKNLKSIINSTLDIEQAYKKVPLPFREQEPLMSFYKDADLLTVVGSPHAVETAGKIISALPGQNSGRTIDANGTTTIPVDLQNNGTASGHAGSHAPAPATSQP